MSNIIFEFEKINVELYQYYRTKRWTEKLVGVVFFEVVAMVAVVTLVGHLTCL